MNKDKQQTEASREGSQTPALNHPTGTGQRPYRVLMLLENESVPEDCRVLLEAQSLAGAGYEVTVICPTGSQRKKCDTIGPIRVYRYWQPPHLSGLLGYVFEYGYSLAMQAILSFWVLLRHGFDAIHVHTPPDMMGLIAIVYQLLGKRFVFDHHDLSPELYLIQKPGRREGIVYRTLRFFERLACRRADRLIATNQTQQQVQVRRCGASASRCWIVRNGPHAMFLGDVTPEEKYRAAGCTVIGYVGVIGVQDGVDFMIRALAEIRDGGRREDFVAVIVGDGPALNDLRALVDQCNLQQRVHFTGMVPFESVPALIAGFDICLTPDPSNQYNDSCTTIKTMEYMALRKPTVCFRTHENQVTAGDAAVYADRNDIAEFAQAIMALMDDPERREQMGILARERIDSGLTWQHQSEALVRLYDGLAGCRDRPAVDGSGA